MNVRRTLAGSAMALVFLAILAAGIALFLFSIRSDWVVLVLFVVVQPSLWNGIEQEVPKIEMLRKIIDRIREKKVSSVRELSEDLGVSVEFAGVMIDDLVNRGYLRRVRGDAACSGSRTCTLCSNSCASPSSGGTLWELVERG